jgi:hypothetical protein
MTFFQEWGNSADHQAPGRAKRPVKVYEPWT